ncbi:MAG: hypothetical protein IJ896_06435 [Fibrobacter sp.]|nr:hypothetical protein [Fibrobacter sp.]
MLSSRLTRSIFASLFLVLGIATLSHAEEKSLWQKFKDFFSPMPTVEGEGPEYDKLRDLNKRINTLEGKYSRERRPNNKANIKKELDALKAERDTLEEELRKNPPQSSSSAIASSSAPQSANATSSAVTCKTDTVFVRDTVVVHDTLYVIVADKKAEEPAPSTPAEVPTVPAPDSTSQDSTGNPQPGTK